ncbi:MAG TPA: NAD(P)H-hydrate dehydratase [Kofleriaceae bacterium]|nr:NAD(P)H-hydrate dehydratase [Kofleriaceae bacterium]
MLPVATAAEMRALDAATIEDIGLPGSVLMETAGRGVAAAAAARTPPGARIAVVCGSGNNGGDGFVAARVLRAAGHDAVVFLVAPRSRIGGDAALHLAAYEKSGGVISEAGAPSATDLVALGEALDDAAVIVDAVFGTGLDRTVEGHLAAVIARMNEARGTRIAVDIPSGLSADTGHPLGVAVQAHHTVTMAVAKVGIAGAPGVAHAGTLEIVDIGIPRALCEAQTRAALVERADARGWAPAPNILDHKGRRGHVAIIGGSPGKRGAARLAAVSALRTGAGLCTLAGPASVGSDGGELTAPDAVMTATLDDAASIRALLGGKRAAVVGPGMPDDARGRAWVDAALASDVPLVLDATALAHLAGRLADVAAARTTVVLTPHPGEAARLLGETTDAIQADRMRAVRALAAASRAVVVLKGARTLVCDGTLGDDFVTINPTGGPALATGGTGDVLAGAIGALLAQGVAPAAAARLGVWLHGVAGDALAARLGPSGVIASDLPDAIAVALRDLSH